MSQGKKESYLKDDREYKAFLIDRIQSGWELGLGDDGDGEPPHASPARGWPTSSRRWRASATTSSG